MITIPSSDPERPHVLSLEADVGARFKTAISVCQNRGADISIVVRRASALPALCKFLFWEAGCSFGGLIVEEKREEWQLLYVFLLPGTGWIHVLLQLPIECSTVPSISPQVHAADWYERQITRALVRFTGMRFPPLIPMRPRGQQASSGRGGRTPRSPGSWSTIEAFLRSTHCIFPRTRPAGSTKRTRRSWRSCADRACLSIDWT